MTGTRIILLRHGETVWNVEGRYQGHLDSPLTATGEAQARALAVRLAGRSFARLYSSDLGRAQRTAECIAARTGREIVTDARLRERHLGIFQRKVKSEMKEQFPEAYRRFKSADPDYVIPTGESARQRAELAVNCLVDLGRKHAGEEIVVVTHGGVVSAMFRHTFGIPLDAPRRFARANASWNVFVWEQDRWMLETWGDTSHWPAGAGRDDL